MQRVVVHALAIDQPQRVGFDGSAGCWVAIAHLVWVQACIIGGGKGLWHLNKIIYKDNFLKLAAVKRKKSSASKLWHLEYANSQIQGAQSDLRSGLDPHRYLFLHSMSFFRVRRQSFWVQRLRNLGEYLA
ncbi:MAG: hypothetical protein ABF285_15030, partial [Pacificibacter sp.]